MKITTKHKIAYKAKDAPGEPVEMAIWQDEDGDYLTAIGGWMAEFDGVPKGWVQRIIDGTSTEFVGHIIPPPFQPHVGMVVENPKNPDEDYAVCYWVNGWDSSWMGPDGAHYGDAYARNHMKNDGWRVREVGA